MDLSAFRQEVIDEVIGIIDPEFQVEFSETETVPSLEDTDITHPNFGTKKEKCKLIETCVLYVDIRQSTELNLSHKRETMAKLYTSFVRSMIRAAELYSGRVRNIVGDRVMVVFDKQSCFTNAVNTAILLQLSISIRPKPEFPL